MKVHRLRSFEDYLEYKTRDAVDLEHHWSVIRKAVPHDKVPFTIDGYSYTAGKQVKFQVSYQLVLPSGDIAWREDTVCPLTWLNNRMRFTIHVFDIETETYPDSNIYMAEQKSSTFEYFRTRYANVIGSEYFGDRIPYGSVDQNGIRNENLCELTFPDKSFDTIISQDVFEHIPDLSKALEECYRVLRDKGQMLFSVPFDPMCKDNIVLARSTENGIEILQHPPAYHRDPLSEKGVLCFHYFGWELLSKMRTVGFSDAYAICAHSLKFGYLGGEQFIFFAKK